MRYLLLIIFYSFCNLGFSQEIQFTDYEKNWIKNHPVIEFGYDPRWEPYEIYSNGEYSGIISDYVKIIEEKTGIKMRPIPDLTWDQSMKGLINGSIMVVPNCVVTPERKKWLELSEPYITDPIVIVARKNATYFSTLDDLSGKTIALPESYYTIDLIKENFPEIIINEYGSIQECLESVIAGKSDAFVGKLNVITYYKNHYGFGDLRIVGVTPFKESGISFGINPEWKTFKGIVDKVLNEVSAHQKHEIRGKWIGINKSNYFSSSFFIWSLLIFISILVGFIIVYYWNRVLKKILKRKKKTEYELKKLLIDVKKRDEEKKVLLQEIHHRVKNNLQIVSSILNMQANTIKDPNTSLALKDAVERIKTIALVHDKVYKSPTISEVNLTEYIESLYLDLQSQYPKESHINLNITHSSVKIAMDSLVPLALIITELITNSFNHAFKNQDNPKITIKTNWLKTENTLELKYMDNGSWKENGESDHFGTSLIDIFTEQIDGTYSLNKTEEGTIYTFEFKNMSIVTT
ncbi:MAG TPA: transporter substrate-binding domain-containing protein [Brumimicrobium sp.]|nr:transporter substrate-binding domain-containing protein [Brumimicrobium sp.]